METDGHWRVAHRLRAGPGCRPAFKWEPSFIHKFSDYLTGAKDGQPRLIKDWIDFWIKLVKVDPHVFAHLAAVGETAVAIGLILGAFSNLTYLIGTLLATIIWTAAEGFGGPTRRGPPTSAPPSST